MAKIKSVGLKDSIVTTYGDTTKTYRTSLINSKVIALTGKTALGAPLNVFLSTTDDFGVAPVSLFFGNNRIFVMGAISAGLGRCMLYDFDPTTGSATPVGSILISFVNSPATTHTVRSFAVDDGASSASVTGWKIFVATTGSVAANGGLYMAGCAAAGIAKTDFTASPTTIPTATLADSKQVYKLENSPFTLTASAAIALQKSSTNVYLLNGVSATYQAYKVDYSLPTGAPGAGGIITTLNVFGGTGITGNLPALSGTLLLTNCGKLATPTAAYFPVALLNNDCFFFATTTFTYIGLLSELTAGGTTWPSLTPANNVIPFTPGVYINPIYSSASWSNLLQREFMNIGASNFVTKTHQNNLFEYFFGSAHDRFLSSGGYTGFPNQIFGGITVTQTANGLGWLGLVSTAGSQTGIVLTPIAANHSYGLHYIISKVVDTNEAIQFLSACAIQQLSDITDGVKLQYRTSGFASETVGWLDIPASYDMTSLVAGDQIQFRILFRILSETNHQSQQVEELYVGYVGKNELSENWEYSRDQSTTTSPTRCVFRLKTAYSTSVPTLYFRAYDLTNALIVSHNTSANPGNFEYSTNNGSSWNSLGTIPNTVGTLVRYSFSSPPGVDIRPSIRES